MNNIYNQNNQPVCLPSWSTTRQRRRLHEHESIPTRDIVGSRVAGTAIDPKGTLSIPAVTVNELNGQHFLFWAPYRRLNLFWYQLELVDNRASNGAVDDLPQRPRNGA